MSDSLPITNLIHSEFRHSMTAVVDASDLRWTPGVWAKRFYIVGRPLCFQFFQDIHHEGELVAKVYRDVLGYEIVVNND